MPPILHGLDIDEDRVDELLDQVAASDGAVLYFHGGLSTRSYVEDELGPELLAHYLDPAELAGRVPVLITYDAMRIDMEQVRALLGRTRLVRAAGWLRRFLQRDRSDEPFEPEAQLTTIDAVEADEDLARSVALEALEGLGPVGLERPTAFVFGDDFEEPEDALLRRVQDTLFSQHFQLMSLQTEVERFLAEEDPLEAAKGLGPLRAARIVYRILQRYGRGTDHGLVATIAEELMRGLSIAGVSLTDVAQNQWTMVHRRARRLWEGERNAAQLLQGLAEIQGVRREERQRFRITLVSHSAGAIPICRLLQAADDTDLQLELDIVFIAPAASFRLVSESLIRTTVQVTRVRNFLLDDAHESADHLLGPLYPRSLLYFVSGVAERDGDGDMMLIGLDRHMQPQRAPYCEPSHPPRLRGAFGDVRAVWWRFGSDELVHCPDLNSPIGRANDGTTHEDTKLPTQTPLLSATLRYLLTS